MGLPSWLTLGLVGWIEGSDQTRTRFRPAREGRGLLIRIDEPSPAVPSIPARIASI